MMVKCPDCKEELLKLPCKMADGKIKELFIHPINSFKKCQYSTDGIKMEVSIYDDFLCSKFQELVEHEGIKEEPLKVSEQREDKTNDSLIKKRLAEGSVTATEYKEIRQLLNEDVTTKS
jgi:hypothetical protein